MKLYVSVAEYIKLQRNSEKYTLLKNDPTTTTDREDFAYTKKALDVIGLTSDEILSIFKLISIILKLGNRNGRLHKNTFLHRMMNTQQLIQMFDLFFF